MTPARPTAAPRRILSRLRELMAGGGTAQDRLSRVVRVIADGLKAEVCSVYLMRAGEVLELFATHGLKPESVHVTRLRVGEGLIGDIAAHARPLALSDAQSHPHFAYRPETGEEVYHSMMGVPILRGGRVIGVLAVQNVSRRHYTDEELETLETIAMVLAELAASGELVDRAEFVPTDGIALLPLRLEGMTLNGGVGLGVAVLHRPRLVVRTMVAEDSDAELSRLHAAVRGMHGALDQLLASSLLSDGEHRDIIETYRMIAEDAGWLTRIEDVIATGLTAEAAVQRIQDETRARMSQVTDSYLRERVQDLEDLANRLLAHLSGADRAATARDLPENAVLVARNMGPAELLDYDPKRLRALILEEGSPTAHVAIIARALDIPVVGQVKGVLDRIEPLDSIVVDGDNGQIFLRPAEDLLAAFQENVRVRARRRAAYADLKGLPSETRDGVKVLLGLNAGLLVDAQRFEETDADAIGLYRTEIPFLARSNLPDVTAQTALYAKILDLARGKPVIFRTLDAGGDKVLPYWSQPTEENPAMGWRAIRLTLDRPSILRQQLRALVQAGAGRDLRIMFPMVAEIGEFDAARALLDLELARHAARGAPPPSQLKVGVMLEVPSLLFQMKALLRRVDFVSIGSNDLFQFLFAADRGNPHLAQRYDELSPTGLAVLREILTACRAARVPVSVCGEMAGRPLDAMVLLGLGFRAISMAPPAFGPVKAMVRSLDVGALESYLNTLGGPPRHSLRSRLKAFALDHGVVI